jgi:hypothetical protein
MATTRKLFTDVMGGREATSYIGSKGEIFYDQDVGTLRLSDGQTQGGIPLSDASVSRYVAVNVDGVISGSYNGIDWNDYTSNLNGIERVAVGPTKIVYIADSSVDNDFNTLWYADNYDTEPTEVGGMPEKDFSEVKYFKSISKFVAVGRGADGPELHYSSDGVTWISSSVDPTYYTELDVAEPTIFSDISENTAGFFILSNKAAFGGFFLSNITDTMDASTHIDLSNVTDADLDEISWVDSGEFIGWHLFIQGEGTSWWVNDALDPTTQQFADFGLPIQQVLEDNIGVSSSTSEIVVGEYNGITTIMVATNDGQIMYWAAIPAGPYVSIPKPYTATISGWTSASPTVVSYTTEGGNSDGNQGGEKFVVSGSENADYNGTYYLGSGNTVYTDSGLTVPFDTTGLTAFTGTATITWSHGQYIDALHYSDGIFYAGNDNEEIFVSTDGGETWAQADQLLGGQGEGDGYLNDIDSFIGNTTTADIGDITFSGVEIRGIAAEQKNGLIKLVPNTNFDGHSFVDNGQFVQIYPTNQYDAPHIHIAAGSGANGEGDLFLGDDNKYVQVSHFGEVSIQSYDSAEDNTYNWTFVNDGTVHFPPLLTNLHNGGSQTAQTLKFANPNLQVVITGPTPSVNVDAQRLIIQGQRASGTGEGGDVYVWGGDAEFDGGDIKIYAGDADDAAQGYGGYVNINGGRGFNSGGQVYIKAGDSNTDGADVALEAGTGTSTNGKVRVQVNGNTWYFFDNGKLQLPSGGDIVDSDGFVLTNTSHGCFHKTANITAPAADTAYGFDWYTDTTAHVNSKGVVVTIDNPTRVNILETGNYKASVEMQLKSTVNDVRIAYIWIEKNGVEIAESCVKVELEKAASSLFNKEWLLDGIAANDYIEVKFAVNDETGISLEYTAAQTTPYSRPAIPSATLTVTAM